MYESHDEYGNAAIVAIETPLVGIMFSMQVECISADLFLFRNEHTCAHPGIPSVAARERVPKGALRRQGRRLEYRDCNQDH